MIPKPHDCKICPLYRNGVGFVPNWGNSSNSKVIFVGEAPGDNESKKGIPFVEYAAAGSKLKEVLTILRRPRSDFRIGNIISCQPPKNFLDGASYELTAVNNCKVNLPVIKNQTDNVIVALGKVPMKYLCGVSGEGKENVSLLRGFPIQTDYGLVVPTFHPSYVKRGKPQYIQYLIWDVEKAIKLAKSKPTKPTYNFIENPSRDEAKQFYYKVKSSPNLSLAYDIETEDSADTEEDERQGLVSNTITQIQFSLEKNYAIAFPWSEDWLKIIQLLMLTENWKLGFNNYNFDDPRMRDKGFRINGKSIDVMWMWKHWNPGLERGLQKVASCFDYPEPWKHKMHLNLANYGCHDVNALQYIFPKLKEWMERDGVWN